MVLYIGRVRAGSVPARPRAVPQPGPGRARVGTKKYKKTFGPGPAPFGATRGGPGRGQATACPRPDTAPAQTHPWPGDGSARPGFLPALKDPRG